MPAPARRLAPTLFAACLLLAPGGVGAQEGGDPLAGFDAYVRDAVAAWEAPGLAVAVVKDGETVFARGYGVRAAGPGAGPGAGEGEPVDAHTLFAIGSTTKAMTAAALGMMVDEGRVAWDAPVIEYLPWFRLADPWATREVTVRDLLTHRAGLGNADLLWYGFPDRDRREVVEALRHLDAAYSLRAGFIYQNVMYAAAGQVLEAVSGMTWDAFVRTRIFEPLGMDRTVATLAEAAARPNVAAPHDRVEGELRVIDNASVDAVAPAGSVWSSVTDMSRWLAFLLRGCRTEGGEALLEPATCEELFAPQVMVGESGFYPTARLTEPHWTTYALGWFQQDYEGRKVDFHTGSIDGMVAIAGLLRDEGVGVYVLANRDHVEVRHALMLRVFDLYDAEPPRDWSAELKELYDGIAARQDSARAEAESARVEGTRPSLPAEAFAGTYVHEMYGPVVVTAVEEGGLRVAFGERQGTASHWHYDTFRLEWDAAWQGSMLLTFRLDDGGRPAELRAMGVSFRRQREG